MAPGTTSKSLVSMLATWSALTVFVAGMVLLAVLPELPVAGISPSPVAVVLLAGFVLGGGYLGWRSARPALVVAGLVLTGWASVNLLTVCPGSACVLPDGYQHWRHVRGSLQWGVLGPELAVTAEPVACGDPCPYVVELLPLGLGYLLVGAGIQPG